MKFKTFAALVALIFSASHAMAQQGVSKTEITLGSIQDLSGPLAGFGKQIRLGMMLRVDELNEQGGVNGRKIKLLIEDSGYDPKKAILAAQKLVNQDKIFMMVGHLGTAQNLAAMPVQFEKNVINCNYKGILRGRVLATFLLGSKRLYDFVDDNPFIEMRESSMVNDTERIRRNPKMISINSAIEVDVTGQVCADSIGAKMYSGVGGQMDFIRGASLSQGGKAIIALPSITKNGVSRIVPYLKQGAGVVTTRAHVQYIITENGIADLYGKTLRQRVTEMVKIAHPTHQESIDRQYYEMINKL